MIWYTASTEWHATDPPALLSIKPGSTTEGPLRGAAASACDMARQTRAPLRRAYPDSAGPLATSAPLGRPADAPLEEPGHTLRRRRLVWTRSLDEARAMGMKVAHGCMREARPSAPSSEASCPPRLPGGASMARRSAGLRVHCDPRVSLQHTSAAKKSACSVPIVRPRSHLKPEKTARWRAGRARKAGSAQHVDPHLAETQERSSRVTHKQ